MLRFFFFLSLALNIAFIGATTAYVFQEPRILKALPPALRPSSVRSHDIMFKRIEMALPPEKAAFARREFRALRQKTRGHRERMPELQRNIHALLTAEPFSPDAIRAAHEEMQQGRVQISEEFTETLLRVAEGLNPEERKMLADALPKSRGKREHRAGRRRHGDNEQSRPPRRHEKRTAEDKGRYPREKRREPAEFPTPEQTSAPSDAQRFTPIPE